MITYLRNLVRFDRNEWTGGQYSIFRVIFGAYLFVHFLHLIPWGAEMFSNQGAMPDGNASPLLHLFPNVLAVFDGPVFVTAFLTLAAGLSVMLAAGRHDRLAAIGLWYIWACLFGRNPLIANPGLPYVGLLMVVHAFMPRAPYGSWERRNQVDPGSDWRMPQSMFLVVWVLMALGYTYSGYTKLISPSWVSGTALELVLQNPLARPEGMSQVMLMLPPAVFKLMTWGTLALELFFFPLVLIRRLRPWVWLLMLSMHIGLITMINFADLSLGMVMLHLFTFDPGWIKPVRENANSTLFYDGQCGLCHRAVRFILAEDRDAAFRFAPLDSDAFRSAVPEDRRVGLPDTAVVLTGDGAMLIRSDAWCYIMRRLGGVWRLLGFAVGILPRAFRDRVYDLVAGVRYRVFRKQVNACPMLPKELRERFVY